MNQETVNQDFSKWLTVKEASEALQVDEFTIYRAVYRKALTYAKSAISKTVLIEPNQIESFKFKIYPAEKEFIS